MQTVENSESITRLFELVSNGHKIDSKFSDIALNGFDDPSSCILILAAVQKKTELVNKQAGTSTLLNQ